jgi:hypothetical protein
MGRALKKNLDHPDEHLQLGWMIADVVQVGDASIARTQMAPGAHGCCTRRFRGHRCRVGHSE